ncbi:hypothetical protein MMC30_002718 [Trapelia coarctata]|nr:hypothetical protein [Trapelia coarctata]
MSCHRVSPDYDLLSQAKDSGTIELSASQISPIELTVDFKIVNDRFLYKACTRREIDIQKVTRDRAPLKASTTYTEFQQLIPKYDDPLSYLEPRHILFAKFDALYLGYRDQLSQQGSLLKCGHLDISAGFPILTWTLFKQAETLIHAGLKSATTIQSDIHRCRYCATEIQATVELSPDATCWFAATSWKDLGDGTDQTKQPWITHQQFDPSRVWYRGFYQPTHKHRGCISEALETPTLADTTLHLAVPPFGLFDGEFKFERLYNEDDDLDDLTVNETRNPSDAAEHAM